MTKNVPEMALKLTCNDRVKARFTRDGRQVIVIATGGGTTSKLMAFALDAP